MKQWILSRMGLSGFIERILQALFWGGIVVTVAVPFALRPVMNWHYRYPFSNAFFVLMMLFFLCFGVLMVLLVGDLRSIFRSINEGDPFIESNVRYLGRMARISVVLMLLCAVKCVGDFSLLTFVIAVVFLFLWAFLLVLRELFRSALQFKIENDLTI